LKDDARFGDSWSILLVEERIQLVGEYQLLWDAAISIPQPASPHFDLLVRTAGRNAGEGLVPAFIVIFGTQQIRSMNAAWDGRECAVICREYEAGG